MPIGNNQGAGRERDRLDGSANRHARSRARFSPIRGPAATSGDRPDVAGASMSGGFCNTCPLKAPSTANACVSRPGPAASFSSLSPEFRRARMISIPSTGSAARRKTQPRYPGGPATTLRSQFPKKTEYTKAAPRAPCNTEPVFDVVISPDAVGRTWRPKNASSSIP